MLQNNAKVSVPLIKNTTNLKPCASSNAHLSLRFVIELNADKLVMLDCLLNKPQTFAWGHAKADPTSQVTTQNVDNAPRVNMYHQMPPNVLSNAQLVNSFQKIKTLV